MAIRDIGNAPAPSTGAFPGASFSSGVVLEEVLPLANTQYEVRYIVGASTNVIWRLQQALSSGLGSTAIVDETVVLTPSNQSGEYILVYDRIQSSVFVAQGASSTSARFRVLASTGVTAQYGVKITAEPLV